MNTEVKNKGKFISSRLLMIGIVFIVIGSTIYYLFMAATTTIDTSSSEPHDRLKNITLPNRIITNTTNISKDGEYFRCIITTRDNPKNKYEFNDHKYSTTDLDGLQKIREECIPL